MSTQGFKERHEEPVYMILQRQSKTMRILMQVLWDLRCFGNYIKHLYRCLYFNHFKHCSTLITWQFSFFIIASPLAYRLASNMRPHRQRKVDCAQMFLLPYINSFLLVPSSSHFTKFNRLVNWLNGLLIPGAWYGTSKMSSTCDSLVSKSIEGCG